MKLAPFRDIIAKGDADAVLVAHVFDADLDPTYPASLSHAVVDGMLRHDLGFDGVVITDDLQMGAIREVYGYATAVEQAILAGADILTIANEQLYESGIVTTTMDIVEAAVTAGRIEPTRIDASWRHISTLKARLGSA